VGKEQLEEECGQAVREYVEALDSHKEVVSQFVSIGKVVPGQPIKIPKRPFNKDGVKEIQESEDKLERARQKWHECLKKWRGTS